MVKYWLMKSELDVYPYAQLVADGTTHWDGVRNYQARNNLRDMQVGDLCLYYHSNEGKEVVGIAEVIKPPYQDPTTDNTQWVAVDVKPYKKLDKTVTLAQIKADPRLSDIGLIRQPRLSVISISEDHFNIILELANEP